MQPGLKWLHDNREWVFSGCGLLVLTGVIALVQVLLKSSTPRGLRIEVAFGFLTFGSELSDQKLLFTVTNPGEKPAQLTGIKISLGKHGNIFFPDLEGEKSIPCYVDPGTSLKFWTDLREVQATLRQHRLVGQHSLRATITDGLGIERRSKRSTKLSV